MSKPADEIIGLYQRHAAAFMARRNEGLIEKPWLDRFLSALPDGGEVLDLGCGFGDPIGRYMLDQGYAVTGIDTSEPMITAAQRALPAGHWRRGDMRGLELPRRFDGILAWNSSFHLSPDDQRGLFDVFARHARASAVLMFTSGPEAGELLGQFEGEPLYHASLDREEYHHLLTSSGFDQIDMTEERSAKRNRLVWMARRIEGPPS